jgi:hypothetical protein
MAIDFDIFVDWVENRFDGNVVINGREVRINSVFADSDEKHHLWCNPGGGKRGIKTGVFHCFKTDKKGTLVGLVMHVDKCGKKQALETLGLKAASGKPIEEIDFDFDDEGESLSEIAGKDAFKGFGVPKLTLKIESDRVSSNNYIYHLEDIGYG